MMSDDYELNRTYYAEIRATNRRDPKRYDCPDCGRKGVLSASDKAKGYHCSACTREIEGPAYDGGGSSYCGDY